MGSGDELERGKLPSPDKRKPSEGELVNRFTYHPPKTEQQRRAHEEVSQLTLALAIRLNEICPPGRNLSLALTHIEDARMRANAALACDDPERRL